MRLILSLIYLLLSIYTVAQSPCPDWDWDPEDPTPTWWGTNFAGSGTIQLSTIHSLQTMATNVVDDNITTVGKTRNEANPFIQINTDQRRFVPFIRILSESAIPNFYLLVSEHPIDFNDNLEDLLESDRIISNQYFNYTSGDTIWINTVGQYFRVQLRSSGELTIGELRIPGDDLEDEICDNEEDDNCDGKIDCEDIQCGAEILNAYGVDATCPICGNGEIHFQPAFGENLEFSIDGGTTYSNACWNDFHNMCYWTGVEPGDYTVLIRNSVTGCTYEYPHVIEVRSPGPGVDGICENGGFELGTFVNWEGGFGVNDNPNNPPHMTDFFIDTDDNHTIINTALDLPDPLVGEINGNYPGLGMYVAKLGTNYAGLEAEFLEYCFDVTQDNADFHFLYALVFEHPGSDHNVNQRPFFSWRMYIEGFPVTLAGDQIYSSVAPPFNQTENSGKLIAYKGWTCQPVDLSNLIGSRVCFYFLTADCTETDHLGYAYIDALCSPASELAPEVSIMSSQTIYCEGDIVELEVHGSGYNSFTWIISKLDGNDNEYETVEVTKTSDYDASLVDLVQFYEGNSEYSLDCTSRIKATLVVENDCGGEKEVSKIV